MSNQRSNDGSLSHRLKGAVLRPLGYTWLPRREVAVITRDEVFHRLERGGQWFLVAPGIERVAFTVDTLPDETRFTVPNIQTLDGVQLTVTLKVEYLFDPFRLPPEKHGMVAKRCHFVEDRRVIVQDQAQRALQEALSRYSVVDMIATGSAWSRETELWAVLDRLLNDTFALFLLRDRCSIQEIIPPQSLSQRLEMSAQRRIALEVLRGLSPREYNALLRGEAIESLGSMTSGSPYVSVPDLTDPNVQVPQPTLPPGTPPKDEPGAPTNAPSSSGSGTTTPTDNPASTGNASGGQQPRRPRSMIDE